MNELVPEIGIPECIANVDKPLGTLRMAGRRFVLQEYVIVKKADLFHSFSVIIKKNAEYSIGADLAAEGGYLAGRKTENERECCILCCALRFFLKQPLHLASFDIDIYTPVSRVGCGPGH